MTRWQIFGAVALRRLPELMPSRDPIQIKVQQVFDAYEASNSRYSQHELRHMEDIRLRNSDGITDVVVGETAQDCEDRWLREKQGFKFGDHNDRLSKTQYLFIMSKFGTDIKDQWLLPQATFDRKLGDKNLVDTARRALKDSLNIQGGYKLVSKVPSSVRSFNYPKKVQSMTGFKGAKVFFLKAHLDLPDASVLEAIDASKNERLKWMTQDEARPLVSKDYLASLCSGLFHEDRVDVKRVLGQAAQYAKTIRKLSSASH